MTKRRTGHPLLLAVSAAVTLTAPWVPPAPIAAQDSHYWSEQYGTRANLLAGAMIGSVSDLSAIYYNPGAIALLDDAGFILSARTNRFTQLTLEGGAGPGRDLASSSTRPLPTMLSGSLRFGWLGKSRLSYTILTRRQFDAHLVSSRIDARDVLPAPGIEDIAAAFTADVNITDLWAGLAWSHPLGERVGFGITQFFASRSQSIGSQLLAQAATQAGDVSIATRLRDRSLTHYRTLWKAGLSFDLGALSAGVTVTTPSIGLGGSGSAIYNSSVSGLDVDGDGTEDPSLAANIQRDVSAHFKSSLAIGAGAAYALGNSRIHVSAEWFSALDRFTLLDTDPFTGQTSGQPIENDLTGEFASVLNWALGLEHAVGERTSLYAGFATDRSAATSDAASDFVTTEYDINRVGGGASFVVAGTEIMLGLLWAGGSAPFPQLFELGDLDVPDDLLSGDTATTIRFRQWTVVFGFELSR